MKKNIARLASIMLALQVVSTDAAKLDRFGGFTDVKGEKTGFFHTQRIDDRWL